ncbi:MAG: cobalamin-dependent protein [Tannerella sp.]|jgi:radical SAM superfamily enzyme YgiQ (UPF0313 family)|nr:cobalamin-dependent protein [Tannerella sp.]
MKKCIALVSANRHRIPYPVYPLGISYLTSYLSAHLPDCEIRVFDFNLGNDGDFAAFLQRHPFDLVGISLRNFDDSTRACRDNLFIAHYREIMRIARAHTQAPIVLGGAGFSVFPELILHELNPDYAILGEGEAALTELIVALSDGSDPARIDRLAWRDAGGAFRINTFGTKPRGGANYISSPVLHVENDWAEYYWNESGMLNIQTKRGCPYRCIYCSYPLVDGRRVRTLDAKTVVANIEELYFAKGISYLFFTDSIFNIHREYNEELARRLIESRADICWGAYFAPHNLTAGDLKLYQQSGLTHVEFGTDSLSDRQLEHYNKKFRFSDIREQSMHCSNLGIFYAHFLILGGYGETDETLDETFAHSRELGLTVYFPYIGMRVYPRTKLCDIALREGLICSPDDLIDPVYYLSKDIDSATIEPRAKATGQRWIFTDDEPSPVMEQLRRRGKKGPLWEFLRY